MEPWDALGILTDGRRITEQEWTQGTELSLDIQGMNGNERPFPRGISVGRSVGRVSPLSPRDEPQCLVYVIESKRAINLNA